MADTAVLLTEVSGLDEAVVRPFVEAAAEDMSVDEMADVLCRLQPHIDVLGIAEVQQAVHKLAKERKITQLLTYLEKKENERPTTQQPKIGFFKKLLSREPKDKAGKAKSGGVAHEDSPSPPSNPAALSAEVKVERKVGNRKADKKSDKKDGKKAEHDRHAKDVKAVKEAKPAKPYGTELDVPEPQPTVPPAVVIDESQLPANVAAAANARNNNKLQIPQSSELAKNLVETEHELAQKYNFMQQKSMTLKTEDTHPAGHHYTEFDDILNKFIEDKGK